VLGVSLFGVFLFLFSRAYFSQTVRQFAANKAKLRMSIIINDAMMREVVPNLDTENLMVFRTNDREHVTDVIIDVQQVNHVITRMSADMQRSLQEAMIEEELSMPLGVLFGHPVLNMLGPSVQIDVQMTGNVVTDIVTRTTPYGINNSLIEVLIQTELSVMVIIPFQQEEVKVTTYTPLVIKVIQGEVPQYYYNSSGGIGGTFIPPPRNSEYPD